MRITDFSIYNYRGASRLEIALDRRLNVFFGVNGSGKSTVLDATAVVTQELENSCANFSYRSSNRRSRFRRRSRSKYARCVYNLNDYRNRVLSPAF